jgi:hypothetical protein
MRAANGRLLVSVNMEQKDTILFNGIELKMANLFEANYREKSPVLCLAEASNEVVQKGEILICHHNHFYQPSPYFVSDDLFSIPVGSTIFASVKPDGSLQPLYGNLLCNRVEKATLLPMPPELVEKYTNRLIVTDEGNTPYSKGETIFTRPHSYYEIVYTLNGTQHRIHKCHESMIMGVIRTNI